MMDVAKVTQLVSLAKASHDFVVVSVHYGAEGPSYVNSPHSDENYFGENRGNMRAFSKIAIDAGADLVMGHGPHVLRGLELYKNKLIVHSLGNFATYSGFLLDPVSRLGAIVDVGLDDNGDFLDGQIISTHQFYERTPSGKRGQIRLEIDRKKRAAQQIAILTNKDFEMRPVIRSDGSFFRDRSN